MSEFQDEQGFDGQDGGGESYVDFGETWNPDDVGATGGLDPLADPAEYEAAVRGIIEEAVAPALEWVEQQQQERAFARAGEEIQQVVAGHGERLGVSLDAAEVHAVAGGLAGESAFAVLVENGYSPEQARQVVQDGGAFQVLTDATGVDGRELALEAIRLAAEQQALAHQQPRDESALVGKHVGLQRGVQPARPSQAAALPAWATDLIRRA